MNSSAKQSWCDGLLIWFLVEGNVALSQRESVCLQAFNSLDVSDLTFCVLNCQVGVCIYLSLYHGMCFTKTRPSLCASSACIFGYDTFRLKEQINIEINNFVG